MENTERKLYPMRFPAESGLADLGLKETEVMNGWLAGSTISEVMETYLERVTGETVYSYFGRQFPLLMRLFKVEERLPLMVCPDDAIAFQRYDTLGKTKFWYVADAEPGSKLYLGFKREVPAGELYDRCLSGTLEEVLNEVTPHKGQGFIIPPGLVHSASAGLVLAEISESSDLDFKVYNWGNPVEPVSASFTSDPSGVTSDEVTGDMEELSLEAAFDFLNMGKYDNSLTVNIPAGPMRQRPGKLPEDGLTDRMVSRDEFIITRIRLQEALHIYTERFESFLAYLCVGGEASFQVTRTEGGLDEYILRKGEVLLVPEEVADFFIVPRDRSTVLLEAYIGPREENDEYIDPDAEPRLRGEDYEENSVLGDIENGGRS
ncbi:MAG: class I mannose-6-phosphate isomerase [Candidatus Cryptobacteroides sp.]